MQHHIPALCWHAQSYEGFHVTWCCSPLPGAGVETVPACISRKCLNGNLRRLCMRLSWWTQSILVLPRKLLRWSLLPRSQPHSLVTQTQWTYSLQGTEKSVRNTWGQGCHRCTSDGPESWELHWRSGEEVAGDLNWNACGYRNGLNPAWLRW